MTNARRSLSFDGLPADGVTQEIVAKRGKRSALLVVLAVAVAAGGGFVKISFVAHRLQLCRHLAGMAGVDAVVAPARRDQDRRVMPDRDRVVVGGNLAQKTPVLGV